VNLSAIAIKRPVFTVMMTLALLVLGVLGFKRLGTDLFPDVSFPVVMVTIAYPGASPDEVENLVSKPVEDAVIGLNGIDRVRSFSREGMSQTWVMFKLGVDIADAATQVRERVSQIRYKFPTERVPDRLWAAELARLQAPLGVWAILGNHDWWYHVAAVRSALAGVKIPVLENQAVLLDREGHKFWLAGLGDQLAHPLGHGRFRGVDDLPGTLEQIRTDDPVVLLVHEPDIFPRVPSRVALTLAGHTHGGQIRLPLVWPLFVPSKFGARFAYGHVVEDERHLIVSGGLGTSIIPARLGVPPEIVHVRLGA